MTRRDDMVIVPRLVDRRDRTNPRRRAAEERRTQVARRKQRGFFRRVRRAMTARRLAAGRRARRRAKLPGRRLGVKAGVKSLGLIVGNVAAAAIIAAEALNTTSTFWRRVGMEHSSRLVQAQQAHIIMGALDESATASATSRGEIESRRDLLMVIAQQGYVNNNIFRVYAGRRYNALWEARGADVIERDPEFDSPDTLTDLLIRKVKVLGRPTFLGKIQAIKTLMQLSVEVIRNRLAGMPYMGGR